jgi:hypothetical protein
VELTLDLLNTPPDKILSRLFGALEQVGADVTLLVLLRDTPEYVGVAASAYQALRSRGYSSDSSRMPSGGQRLRVRRAGDAQRRRNAWTDDMDERQVQLPASTDDGPQSTRSGALGLETPGAASAAEAESGLDSSRSISDADRTEASWADGLWSAVERQPDLSP